MGRAAVLVLLIVAACGPPSSGGTKSSPTAQPAVTATVGASPSSSPPPSPSAAPGPASLVHCAAAVPAGDNLVIGTVVGDPTVVVRDIQDPANARNLCKFDAAATAQQFVSTTQVAYETTGQIIKADLTTGATTVLAAYGASFGSGQYAISPDGRSVTYLDGNAWRLSGPSGDRLVTTLPAVPARGVSPDQDDSFLSFSPDGLYIALVQTFHTSGSGATAPDQVRKAGDGSLVYSTSGMTMGVWSSIPSRLFFQDAGGTVHRWDPRTGVSSMLQLHWIRPRSSPDGRWIAYTFRTQGGLGTIGLYSVQSNTTSSTSVDGRSGARFLSNDLIWYFGERACNTCFGALPAPTGLTYIYSIAGGSEFVSRLTGVIDAWPHSTPPGL
jgi:hypothetical protein